MVQRTLQLGLLTVLLASTGCVAFPQYEGQTGTVTGDVGSYLRNEWGLGHPNPQCAGTYTCQEETACGDPSCQESCDITREPGLDVKPILIGSPAPLTGILYREKKPEPIPQVPNEPGPPGRFFPVPVRPVFAPQGDRPMDIPRVVALPQGINTGRGLL